MQKRGAEIPKNAEMRKHYAAMPKYLQKCKTYRRAEIRNTCSISICFLNFASPQSSLVKNEPPGNNKRRNMLFTLKNFLTL